MDEEEVCVEVGECIQEIATRPQTWRSDGHRRTLK